jgi:alpha-tubulin suppressor-like RCC1 family protein
MSLLARLLTLQAQTTVVPNLLYTWGDNASGQIGNSTIINRSSPQQIGTNYWKTFSEGDNFTVAIKTDGTLWAWGTNTAYQLGLSDTINRSSPVQVTALSDWVAVSAGSSHAAAIQSDGSLYTFGSNQYGQLGKDITLGLSDYMINVTNAFVAVRDDGLLFSTGAGYPVNTTPSTYNFGLATIWNTLSVSKPWAKVTAGDTFGAALTTDGDLYLWGSGAPGGATTSVIRKETTTVKFTQLSAGYSHLMLLGADGYLYAYGNNTYGQLGNNNRTNVNSPIRIGTSTWKTIQAGGFFSMAIDSSDNVYTWGYNLYGQLGLGNRISRSNPTQLSSNISKISASGDVGAYINSSGSLFTWGFNDVGQLGLSDTIHRSSPVQVGTNSWKFLSAGSANMAAIDLNNTLWAWGNGNYYQIDPGSNQFNYSSPVQITAIPCVSVRINSGVIAFQTTNNEVYTRGFAQYGTHGGAQLPPGVDKSNLSTISTGSPTVRIGLQKVGSGSWNLVSAGLSHTIATDTNNKLWAWGGNTNYQLGLQDTRSRSSPTQITTASSLSFTQISAGAEHNHALTNNGELYGWGKNSAGEVGMLKHRYNTVTFINGNWIAIDQQGYLWTCGSGLNSQNGLLDLTVTARSSPTQISTDVRYSAVQMSALGNTIALGVDGSLWTWGTNSDGGLGSNLNTTQLLARSSPAQVGTDTNWSKISTKYYGGLAIKTDGSLWAWGAGGAAQGYLNQQGYSTIARSSPTQIGTSSWTMVSGGVDHVLAITVDGKLWGWGTNNQGQLGINTTTARSSAVQISAGTSFIFCAAGVSCSYAIDTGYKLWAWGINTNGQLGISAGIANRSNPVQVSPYKATSFTQVFSQPSNAMAIDTDNNLWQFGLTNIAGTGIWPNASTSDPNIVGAGTFTNAAAEAFPQLKYSWMPVGGGGNATQNRYAITTDGTLQMFGPNAGGQSGIFNMAVGTTPARSSPVQVNAFGVYPNIASPTRIDSKSYTSISSGTSTTVAIDSNSKLYTWGSNPNGQLGFYHAIRNVHLGYLQTYVLSNKGNIYMWGSNTGFLTQGTPLVSNRSFPVQITNNTAMMPAYSRTPVFSKITALDSAIAGLDIYGKLWVWGRNGSDGPLGTNSIINRIAPVQMNNKTYIDVSGQAGTTLYLIDSDYKLWVCGNNANGQLGTNDVPNRSSPVQLLASSSVSLVHGSRSTGLFMTIDGVLWGCGGNGASAAGSYGALLTGDTIARSSPVIVTSDTSWKLIKTGWNGENAAGIKNDDTLWVWGGNNNGQLGQNDRVERNSPVQIPGSWINIAWGYRGAMALRSDYTVWAWGQSIAGNYTYNYGATTFNRSSPVQLSVNGQFSFTQIDASYQTTAFVLTDGTLWMCGQNNQGGLGDNSILARSSPVQVGAGTLSPLTTLLANEATNPVSISVQLGTNNWSKVADGRDFMLATRTNETLWAWGLNTSGQLGNNDGISRSSPVQISSPTTGSFTQIVAGTTHAGFIFKPTT